MKTLKKKDALRLAKISNAEYNDMTRRVEGRRKKPFLSIAERNLGQGHHTVLSFQDIVELSMLLSLRKAGLRLTRLASLQKNEKPGAIEYTSDDGLVSIIVQKNKLEKQIGEMLV